MRSIFAALALALTIASGSATAAPSKPEPFVAKLGEEVLNKLGSDVPRAERARRFEAMIGEYLALDAISRFVIGRYWNSIEPAGRDAFQDAFTDLLVNRFLPAFEGQTQARLEVRDAARINDRIWAVRVEVLQPDAAPTLITLRLLDAAHGLKVADVITRGVSLGLTLREEYTAFLERHEGRISALIDKLEHRSAELGG